VERNGHATTEKPTSGFVCDDDMAAKTIFIPIVNDDLDETDETVQLTLHDLTGNVLGSPAATTLNSMMTPPAAASDFMPCFLAPVFHVRRTAPCSNHRGARSAGGPTDPLIPRPFQETARKCHRGKDYCGVRHPVFAGETSKEFFVTIKDDNRRKATRRQACSCSIWTPGSCSRRPVDHHRHPTSPPQVMSPARHSAVSAASESVSHRQGQFRRGPTEERPCRRP
jgi:hypothetical protein